jgi:hypothetical protein
MSYILLAEQVNHLIYLQNDRSEALGRALCGLVKISEEVPGFRPGSLDMALKVRRLAQDATCVPGSRTRGVNI